MTEPKNSNGNSVINTVKLWLFPALISILYMLQTRDLNEMRQDIKLLLTRSSIDKTEIDNLKNEIKFLKESVFPQKRVSNLIDVTTPLYFKHEDFYDIKKYLPNDHT